MDLTSPGTKHAPHAISSTSRRTTTALPRIPWISRVLLDLLPQEFGTFSQTQRAFSSLETLTLEWLWMPRSF